MPHRRMLGRTPRTPAQFDSWPDPALLVDKRYRIVAANDAFRARYAPGRRVAGLLCHDVVHGCPQPCAAVGEMCPGAAARASGREHRAIHVHASPSGARCCVDVLARAADARRSRALLIIRTIDDVSAEPSGTRLTGRCRCFRDMLEQMRRVAPTDRPVLLIGEPGSGKEFGARTIHAMGGRGERPFVTVDCARATDLSAQAELFGWPSGNTGEHTDGPVARAEGGTLFLDDLEALPLSLQGAVLRLIESGTYPAAATGEQRGADVRVMCAIEHPPAEAVEAGRLRQDLAAAFACTIVVPPLRARRDDIPLLVASLLARMPSGLPLTVHPRAMALLCRYEYPGNVRELAAILEYATLAGAGATILPGHLPAPVTTPPGVHAARAPSPSH